MLSKSVGLALSLMAPLAQVTGNMLGGTVWIDADRDGLRSDNEPPLAWVLVIVADAKGSRIAAAATGPAGHYQVGGLPDGTYTVCFGLGGFSVTRPNAGEDDLDSDAEQVSGCTRPVNLGPDNRDNPTVDAGVIAPGDR